MLYQALSLPPLFFPPSHSVILLHDLEIHLTGSWVLGHKDLKDNLFCQFHGLLKPNFKCNRSLNAGLFLDNRSRGEKVYLYSFSLFLMGLSGVMRDATDRAVCYGLSSARHKKVGISIFVII